MKFALKDFQERAVSELLDHLDTARLLYEAKGTPVSLGLASTTGSGKTVMAAAVIEALFFGSERFGFPADPGATVLWVTDDPSLNEQTRWRFMEASELIDLSRLSVVGDGFDQETLDPLKVYFINRQKLAASSNLVRRKDGRAHTFWETVANTIASPDRRLYMFVDEAHRGMGSSASEDKDRQTKYARLIDGDASRAPMPVVVGISATPERFERAMGARRGRTSLGLTEVSPADVQASGLLKDSISLLIPDGAGSYDDLLLGEACASLAESERRWGEYVAAQGMEGAVCPLMVVQVPNKVGEGELLGLCDAICRRLPSLSPRDSFAHVFGEHTDIYPGGARYTIRYVPPQRVQETRSVRVLFAKEAVSTGWDCPRAEVLFSMRPGKDRTYITQLLGRMVRNPLARRVEGDGVLNSVSCFLPRFDRKTTGEVVGYLTGERADHSATMSQVPGRRVLTSPARLEWNATLPAGVRDALAALPTYVIPKAPTNPVDRLLDLAGKLALVGIDDVADAEEGEFLCRKLDGLALTYEEEMEAALAQVGRAGVLRTVVSAAGGAVVEEAGSLASDRAVIEEACRRAGRSLTRELVGRYLRRALSRGAAADPLALQARVAAMASAEPVVEGLRAEAERRCERLFALHRDAIYGLPEEQAAELEGVVARSDEPALGRVVVPESDLVDSALLEGEEEHPLPTRDRHVLAVPGEWTCPVNLNDLETEVLDRELGRRQTVAWYRNPSGQSRSALQIPWEARGGRRSMQPDFVFFSQMADGSIVPSIVDPHGTHLSDALDKLRGLACYAERHGDAFKRIEAVAAPGGGALYLDMTKAEVREAVLGDVASAEEVYRKLGREYV